MTSITVRENEAVSVEPLWIRWIISHGVLEECNADRCHTNRRATMPAAVLIADVEEEVAEAQHRQRIVMLTLIR